MFRLSAGIRGVLRAGVQLQQFQQARFLALSVESKARYDKLIQDNKVVVFIKGTAEQPVCGFSRAVVQILKLHGLEGKFGFVNILEDADARQDMKEYSNWPTFPQVYIDGKFVGGCDIMLQLHQSGELVQELDKAGIKSTFTESD